MKKLLVIALATLLCAAFAIPASAFESEFGGYWRTRAYSTDNWDGMDSGTNAVVDTRTRLYYTAKFSDDLKFVNKFEFNNTWGDNVGGDIGTDGTGIFKVKNSYVDYTTNAMNFKMGLQGTVIGRAFMFDDDFAGVIATYTAGKNAFTARWMKIDDETAAVAPAYAIDQTNAIITMNAGTPSPERDYYVLSAALNLSDTLSVSPYLLFDKQEGTETEVYYLGADVDAKVGAASLWTSLIYQGGETTDMDHSGYLLALGADAGIVHGQFFYASGDDDSSDDDLEAFSAPVGKAYYWAEIMGFGVFDNSAGFATSPNGDISNVMALNIGTTLKPMDKLTVSGDLWYAQLVEEVGGEDELGVEIDAKAKYNIHENLNVELVAAYLISGDAVGSEDVMEYGTRLSLSF